VRGNETGQYTYPKAFDQMHALQAESQKLVWDAFYQRNDFAPASSVIATHYATNHGEMPMNKFAKLALAANPSPTLLDNIVHSANPKWGGNWEEIEFYCEKYGDSVVLNNWYTVDGCKVNAIYQMASTLQGGNAEQVTWARSILENAPLSALRNARHTDMFYLRRETVNHENRELALSLFHPASRHATSFAQLIQDRAGVEGFYEEQLPKIEEAKRKRALSDPYNPANLLAMRDIIYKKHPHAVQPSHYGEQIVVASSRPAMTEYASYLDKVAKIAPFRPEVWTAKASLQMMSPGGQILLERNRINRERAILYSNYKPDYVFSYVRDLFVADMNIRPRFPSSAKTMSIQISTDDEDIKMIEIDRVGLAKKLECPMVQMARIADLLCGQEARNSRQCRAAGDAGFVKSALANAREKSFCPSLLNATVHELVIEDTAGL
jgi:hypothetical protein